jgi:sensor histidine kinase YesM
MELPRPLARRSVLLIAVMAATALGAIATGEHHLSMVQHGGDLTIVHALKMGMPYWFIWLLLCPLVIRLVNLVPLEAPWSLGKVLVHLAAAVLLTMTHSVIQNLVTLAFGIVRFPSIAEVASGLTGGALRSLFFDLPAYGAILALIYAAGYYRRFREGESAAAALQVQLAQSRLEALRNQLNPHFFFNAMNSVAMLVRARRNDEAVRTLAGLSDLMRYVLQEQQALEVPLGEELAFLERYLAIERVRFEDRLRVSVRAESGAEEGWVPTMILQPLVENAIRHGIGRRAGSGNIEVTVEREGAQLRLSVLDDGPGLQSNLTPISGTGVGLRNIRERLQRLYGSEQSLVLAPRPEGGTVAAITLPFHARPMAPDPVPA